MNAKERRQRLIQDIIAREPIGTQSDLVERLKKERIRVTQATVSRDITELRLVRLHHGKGVYQYALAPYSSIEDITVELSKRFSELVHDIDRGENTVVVKTAEGHAAGIAALIDRWGKDRIVGSLAGHDTVLVVARTVAQAQDIEHELNGLIV